MSESITIPQISLPAGGSSMRFTRNLNWFCRLLILALVLAGWPARGADEPDVQYLRIFSIIEQADALNKNGKPDLALAKYRQAQTDLQNLRRNFPDWNRKVVAYRLNYLAEKVAALSPKPAPGSAEGKAEAKPGGGEGTEVKLLAAGAEPRQSLRLHPKAGDKQTLTITLKMAMDMKIGEMENPAMKVPAIKMVMNFGVKSVSPEGEIAYEVVMDETTVASDAETAPQIADAMKASFASLKGLSGKGAISSRGINRGTEILTPSGADPQTLQAIEQLKETLARVVVPLPEEAVGSGAKWEVKSKVKSQGMTIDQTATYELAAVEGERLTVKTTTAQSAANQKIANPSMPGMKVDLTKMTGSSKGEVTVDLAQLLPPEASGLAHSDMAMALNMSGQKQEMTMKMDIDVRVEAK